MSAEGPRYAIYYAPRADEPLWRFGSDCLGYDAETGADRRFPHSDALSEERWLASTEEPRRYGLHATLKAPFHLASGMQEADLVIGLKRFAQARKSFQIDDVDVRVLGRFIALTPRVQSPELVALAKDCVTEFDTFRAPLGADDLARRLASPLTARQKELLATWGYPYVMEEFRFHITLTSALPQDVLPIFAAELGRIYRAQVQREDIRIDGVCLFRQETRQSRFRLLRRFAFMPDDTP